MRHYEICIVVHPDQSEQVPAMIERYKTLVAEQGGKIHRIEDWGRRPLAYPIEKLVLVAPAFTYLDMSKTADYLRKGTRMLFHSDGEQNTVSVPKSFYPAFVEIVRNCRDSIASVHCPILFLHGDADEVIPLKSSIHAYEKVTHPDKRLIILHEGRHHLLSEPISANECYQLILLFFKGEIVTRRRTFAPDILDTLQHPQVKEPPASEKER